MRVKITTYVKLLQKSDYPKFKKNPEIVSFSGIAI